VINILNRFFETMVDIIRRFNGSVNEFHGDGILSFFGAPLHYEDDAERAVACAIEMQKAMEDINQYQRRFHLPELAMGIGISRGEVVVGNIGSEKRAKYGAVGAPINTAFRIESYTSGGQILICPDTYAKIRPLLRIKGTIEGRFKGIPGPMTLYDVFGMEGDYQDALPQKPAETMADLGTPLPIQYSALSGKIVSEISHGGHITELGEKHFKALLTGRVEQYDNLKIRILSPDNDGFSDAYAKILSIEKETAPAEPSTAHLVFTWLPGDVKAFLEKYKKRLGSKE
jgi:adenylate cyclase